MSMIQSAAPRSCIYATLSIAFCACGVVDEVEEDETSTTEQAGMTMQGMTMQGMTMQGMTMQGMTMQGYRLGGATLSGVGLVNVRVERGELVAERDQVTLHGDALVGAHFHAEARKLGVNPATALVEYRITAVAAEDPAYDPTGTGQTFLYTLEQWVGDTSSWQPACPADADGRRVAIPLAATWDERGDRIESSTLFTFGCTTGVIAKCYRWGYRPWLTGYGNMADMHWTCTRLARADYCGDGVSHTRDGTLINIWDTVPAPGPIQTRATPPLGMIFEAGWRTNGAACLSHTRWLLGGLLIAAACPDRLVIPGLFGLGGAVCDTLGQALNYGSSVKMFNESYLNLGL